MELVFVILFLLISKRHVCGFSHFAEENWKQVFFVNEVDHVELFVNGYPVGFTKSDFLYFPQSQVEVLVEYGVNGEIVQSEVVELTNEKMIIRAQISNQQLIRAL